MIHFLYFIANRAFKILNVYFDSSNFLYLSSDMLSSFEIWDILVRYPHCLLFIVSNKNMNNI